MSGKILYVGDFNYGDIIWTNGSADGVASANAPSKKFINCLNKNFLLQHVFSPTRVRGSHTPHILDLVITNGNFVDTIEYLSPLGKSDHCVLSISCKLRLSKSNNIVKYKYDKGDYESLMNYFDQHFTTDDVLVERNCVNVDENWNNFKTVLNNGASVYIPSTSG